MPSLYSFIVDNPGDFYTALDLMHPLASSQWDIDVNEGVPDGKITVHVWASIVAAPSSRLIASPAGPNPSEGPAGAALVGVAVRNTALGGVLVHGQPFVWDLVQVVAATTDNDQGEVVWRKNKSVVIT